MPAEELQFGDDTILEVNDGAAAAFEPVDVLADLTAPGASVKKIERKRLANMGYVEQVPSPRKDMGESSFNYEMTDALQARLTALLGITKSWRVTYPDGLRMAFSGFLSKAQPKQVQGEQIAMGDGAIVVQSLITISDETV